MSISIDEMRRIREMMEKFLYTVHGYSISQIEFTSIKRQTEKLTIKGIFKVINKEYQFTSEFDAYGNLQSYEREQLGSLES